jgi:hypothetical protein
MTRVVSLARAGLEIAGAEPLDLRVLVRWSLTHDQRFNSGTEGAYRGKRCMEALDAAEGRRSLKLDQPDWEVLRDALSQPMPGPGVPAYPFRPAHKLLPFIEDMRNAATETEKTVKGVRK